MDNSKSKLVASKNEATGFVAYVDQQTGDAFLTDSLICKITGISDLTLGKIISDYALINYASNYLLGLSGQGVREVNSLRKAEDLVVVLGAYQPRKKEQLEVKTKLLLDLAKAGAIAYIYNLCGYSMQRPAIVPKTAFELAKEQVKLLEAIEFKNTQIKLLEEANEAQSEVIDKLFDYSSIVRIAKYNNCSEKTFKWHALKAASKALKLDIKIAPCPHFFTKNLYSHDAWRLAYPGARLPETTVLSVNPDHTKEFYHA